MKPFQAFKFLISSNKFLKHHDKSKSVIESQDKSSNNKTLPTEEKYIMKNSTYNQDPKSTDYLNQLINTGKEGDPLVLQDNILNEINVENQTEYEKNFNLLIRSIKEMSAKTEILKENQRNIFDFMETKFQNFDNIIKTMISKNKTWRKKYEDIFKLATVDTLKITSKIYSSFEKQKSNDISTNLDRLNRFFSEQIKKLTENKENNEIWTFHPKKNTLLKKNNKKLSQSIQTLDHNFKKKFLVSIKEKIKNKHCENLQEPIESPQIRIVNSEKVLENRLFTRKKEINIENYNDNGICSNIKDEEEIDLCSTFMQKNFDYEHKIEEDLQIDRRSHLFTPEQEKKIITNLIKKEYKSSDDDLQNMLFHKAEFGKENQVKFLISSNWWRNWMTYVSTEIKIYPGEIINRELITDEFFLKDDLLGKRICLKENILEHHNYEALPKSIFRYLKKWYGVDYEIVRFLKKDPIDDKKLYLELYPEKKYGLLNKSQRNRNYSYEDRVLFTNQSLTLNTLNDYSSNDVKVCNTNSSSVRLKSLVQNYNYERPKKQYQKEKQQNENCKIY